MSASHATDYYLPAKEWIGHAAESSGTTTVNRNTGNWLFVSAGVALVTTSLGLVFNALDTPSATSFVQANSVCVTAEDGQGITEAQQLLRGVALTLEESYNLVIERLHETATRGAIPPFSPPVVSQPCPDGLRKPNIAAGETRVQALKRAQRQVDAPSPYNVHVLVLADDDDEILGPAGWSVGPYEERCEEHVCAEVSTALYISRASLRDTVVARSALEAAFGWAATLNYPGGHPAPDDGVTKDGARP